MPEPLRTSAVPRRHRRRSAFIDDMAGVCSDADSEADDSEEEEEGNNLDVEDDLDGFIVPDDEPVEEEASETDVESLLSLSQAAFLNNDSE